MNTLVTFGKSITAIAALALGLGLGPVWQESASAVEPVKLLFPLPDAGALGKAGYLMARGAKMAIEHNGGKVLGRPIEMIVRDTESKGGVAVRRVEAVLEQERGKISAIIGPWSSGVALGVSQVARRRKVLHFFSGGTEDIAGQKCHRYSFMWAAHAYTAADAVMRGIMKRHPNAKRWYTITVNYAFGWSVRDNFRKVGKDLGVTFVGDASQPLAEREFSPYMTAIKAAKPDVIVLINFGLANIQASRTIYNFGLKKTALVVTPWIAGFNDLEELTPEIRDGNYLGGNYHYTVGGDVQKRFVKDYRNLYGEVPRYASGAAYAMTRLALLAMERAGSSDPEKVIDVLEDNFEYHGIFGKTKILSANHQVVRPYMFMRVKSKNEMKHSGDFAEVVSQSNKQFAGDRGCKTKNGKPKA
ncbi:MAG: ABC transporter substrate-binding protein [SAR324 cluster bacterium]|nr:ABC transporter substrate-binding protein [SAR324 cluster bacterium]